MKNVIFNLFFNVGRGGVNSNHCGVVSLKVVGSMPKRKLGRTNASSALSLYIAFLLSFGIFQRDIVEWKPLFVCFVSDFLFDSKPLLVGGGVVPLIAFSQVFFERPSFSFLSFSPLLGSNWHC